MSASDASSRRGRGKPSAKARGGARPGAGRKPLLTPEQRLALGAVINDMLWRETRDRADEKLHAVLAEDDLPVLWADHDRARRATRNIGDRHLWDIQAAIEEGVLQGRRRVPGPTRVAAGIRRRVVRSAALAASQRWQTRISERMAERCLEEYRAFKARSDSEVSKSD